MVLKLNREFLTRHLFALAVFLILGGWFGLDGFIRYPQMSAHDLYVSIEKSEPPADCELEAFKAQKAFAQRILAAVIFAAGLAVALHLIAVAALKFSFDEAGFVCNGKRRTYAEIKAVDVAQWQRKGVLKLAGEGWKLTLDAWHHQGVKDFYEKVAPRG